MAGTIMGFQWLATGVTPLCIENKCEQTVLIKWAVLGVLCRVLIILKSGRVDSITGSEDKPYLRTAYAWLFLGWALGWVCRSGFSPTVGLNQQQSPQPQKGHKTCDVGDGGENH
jgi:hypothetical protein